MAKVIMVQGTASGVGKSVLTTALCRIFTQDGYKTASFKSQNMTSTCHTLPDGRRMARSQALAAYACGAEPTPDMNPILLIMGSGGTEVVINGEAIGIMSSLDYKEYKKHAFIKVLEAYKRLSQDNDIIVIEGAGSPVELNLNQYDIVNMGLAKAVNSPVILVSDIIRGGVFASLYGTVSLLKEDEKQLVSGIIVNKFKGSLNFFKDGVDILESLCNVPVLGVIPYTDVGLEDEDSLTEGAIKTRETLESKFANMDYNGYLNTEFDRLAAHFRTNLDMKKIYNILESGCDNGN